MRKPIDLIKREEHALQRETRQDIADVLERVREGGSTIVAADELLQKLGWWHQQVHNEN